MNNPKFFFHVLVFIILLFFLILGIKNIYFPSQKVLKQHPREITYYFNHYGKIKNIFFSEEDEVSNGSILVRAEDDTLNKIEKDYFNEKRKYKLLTSALINSYKNGASDRAINNIKSRKVQSEKKLIIFENKIDELKAPFELKYKNEFKGRILKIFKTNKSSFIAREPIIIVKPDLPFYSFNKVMAVFSGIFIIIHLVILRLSSK